MSLSPTDRAGGADGLAGFLSRHRVLLCLIGLTAIGLVLRLWWLDARGLTHPEIYVPGLDLPPGISEPPPRHDLAAALDFHFHDEPHPLGWYLAMFGWVRLFGTSEWALRLPSALFGAAAIPVIYLLGTEAYDRVTGLGAAALLTAHGMLVFWSQAARMYVPGFFFAALSLWLLLRCTHGPRRRPGAEIGYLVAVWAGVETTDLFWPFLMLQVAWALMVLPATERFRLADAARARFSGAHRVIQLQAVALMISVPELLHDIYLARGTGAPPPSLGFPRDYLSLGFIASRGDNALVETLPWQGLRLVVLALCLGLMLLGARRPAASPAAASPSGPDLPRWLPLPVALAMTALSVWLALIARHRTGPLLLIAIFLIVTGVAAHFIVEALQPGSALAKTVLTLVATLLLCRWPGAHRGFGRSPK